MITDLTPKLNEIRQKYPEVHYGLQRVTAAIYQEKNTAVPIPDDSVDDLAQGIENGFLSVEKDNVSITDALVLRDYIVRYAAEKIALPKWENIEAFAHALRDIQHRFVNLKFELTAVADVLNVLVHDYHKDLLTLLVDTAKVSKVDEERNWPFWTVYTNFCDVLPKLNYLPIILAQDLDPILQVSDGDGAGGRIYTSVQKLSERSVDLADALFHAFSSRPDSPVVALAANSLVALSTFNLSGAHEKALRHIESPKNTLKRVGISSLGQFDYKDDLNGTLLQTSLDYLDQLRSSEDSDLNYVIVRAYGNLLDQAGELVAKPLVEMASLNDPATQNQMSFVLFQKEDKFHGESWFQEALLRLVDVPSSQVSTLQNLDYIISSYVQDSPQISLAFLKKMVTQRDYERKENEFVLTEVFSSTFFALFEQQYDLLSETVTHWFASDEKRLHFAARDIVQFRAYTPPGTEKNVFTLSKKALNNLGEEVVIHTLMRIMGHVGNSRALVSLLVSSLQRDPCTQEIANFVIWALDQYVLYNYPSEAKEYLNTILEKNKGNSEGVEHKVINTALARSKEYYEARKKLSLSKELQPPSRRVHQLRLAQQKQHASIMEQTNQQSALLSLVNRVPLKYGRAFYTNFDGNFTTPSPLKTISTQWEPPRGEFIDPLGQAHQRLYWQHAGLNKSENQGNQDDMEGSNS